MAVLASPRFFDGLRHNYSGADELVLQCMGNGRGIYLPFDVSSGGGYCYCPPGDAPLDRAASDYAVKKEWLRRIGTTDAAFEITQSGIERLEAIGLTSFGELTSNGDTIFKLLGLLEELDSARDQAARQNFRTTNDQIQTWLEKARHTLLIGDLVDAETAAQLVWEKPEKYELADVNRSLGPLKRLVRGLILNRWPAVSNAQIQDMDVMTPSSNTNNKVFIVHGQDSQSKTDVENLLLKLGLDPVILHMENNLGKTIIEKFEHYSDQVSYAIVLLTPDDSGCSAADALKDPPKLQPRARENVILELGYFIGKLSRSRVTVLNKGIDPPSDVHGLVYVSMETPDWRHKVASDLHAAGFECAALWIFAKRTTPIYLLRLD